MVYRGFQKNVKEEKMLKKERTRWCVEKLEKKRGREIKETDWERKWEREWQSKQKI